MLSSTCPPTSSSSSSLPGLAEGSSNDMWLSFGTIYLLVLTLFLNLLFQVPEGSDKEANGSDQEAP